MAPWMPLAYGFALVLLRCAGLLFTAPVVSARAVPARVRMGLCLVVSFVSFTGGGAPAVLPPEEGLALVGAALAETALGVAAGLGARLVLEAAMAAGQLVGLVGGLGFGAAVDPAFGAESTAVGAWLSIAALGFAVALGLHRDAVAWVALSVQALPPGSTPDLPSLFAGIIRQSLESAALAVRLAYPLFSAVLVAHLALGLAGRLAPQLNLATIGFSLSLLAAGGALFVAAPGMAELAAHASRAALAVRP